MIFITKKAFENEMYNRLNEQNFKGRIEEELYRLKDTVRELQYKVDSLEQSVHQPVPVNIPTATPTYEPAPYWTNPNWKAPDFTCTCSDPPHTNPVRWEKSATETACEGN